MPNPKLEVLGEEYCLMLIALTTNLHKRASVLDSSLSLLPQFQETGAHSQREILPVAVRSYICQQV